MPVPRSEGVEEKKDDDADGDLLPVSPRISQAQGNDEQERRYGFQAQVQNFASTIFGSCGTVLDAASLFVERQVCNQWRNVEAPNNPNGMPLHHEPPPLSIAEELRKLAEKEGRPFPPPLAGPRAADIPKYLGEDAVRSFEDDNISAISQHTLEEMVAQNGILHPMTQRMMQHREQQQREQEREDEEQQQLRRQREQKRQTSRLQKLKKKKAPPPPEEKPEQRPPSPPTRTTRQNERSERQDAIASEPLRTFKMKRRRSPV